MKLLIAFAVFIAFVTGQQAVYCPQSNWVSCVFPEQSSRTFEEIPPSKMDGSNFRVDESIEKLWEYGQ